MATATISKSDAIRKIVGHNPKAPLKEIQAALKEQGLKVSDALINKVKYSKQTSKVRRGRRRKSVSRADAIRQAWGDLGQHSRPRDVVAHLDAQGIKVSSAHVISLRSNSVPSKKSAAAVVSLDDLVAAKAFAGKFGSIEAAKKTLDSLAHLLNN